MMSRVLVVDDEQPILRAMVVNLRARGYDVDVAATGEEALALASRHHPDAVVLDLGLPGISGIDVIRGLRGWTAVPILILSARDDRGAKVAALDSGADDYVTKPFDMEELLARLRAALRRGAAAAEEAPRRRDGRLHGRFAGQAGEDGGPGDPPDPDGVAHRRDIGPQRRPPRDRPTAPGGGVGSAVRRRERLHPGPSRPLASQARTEPVPAARTSSPNQGWATGSSRAERADWTCTATPAGRESWRGTPGRGRLRSRRCDGRCRWPRCSRRTRPS